MNLPYCHAEYVGHVESVRCDFESQQLCPWRLEGGTLTDTPSGETGCLSGGGRGGGGGGRGCHWQEQE